MLVAIDVGNTQIVVGLFADADGVVGAGELVHHWRVATHPAYTADEMALQLSQLLNLDGRSFADITGASIACVVPPVQVALRQMAASRLTGVPAVMVGPGVKTGMPVLVDNPREVGADRVADAVAAFERYGGPTIVVDFGTATNFEVVSAKGEYLGGVLFPGVEISLNSLASRAALLPRVDLAPPRSVLAKNTVEQLQAGVFYGFGAVVDGVCRELKEVVGPATVVATGGLAPVVLPSTHVVDHHEPWLTLYGLRTIFRRNLNV